MNHRRSCRGGLAGFAVVLLALLLGGCAGMQTLPNAARAGDTISLALGGTNGNQTLKAANVHMQITDSSGATYPLTLRDFFRVYMDPTSDYAMRADTGTYWSGAAPLEVYGPVHKTQWMGVVDLTDASGNPLPLQTGTATINYNLTPSGQFYNVKIDILAGTGTPSPLKDQSSPTSYEPLDTLAPDPQVAVTPTGTPSATVGGGLFTFNYTTAAFGSVATQPRAVSLIPGTDVVYSRQDAGNGQTLLTVLVTNPHGFILSPTQADYILGADSLPDMAFAVVWDKSLTNITDANWNTYLTLQGSQYVGLDGTPITGLTTNVTKTQ